MDLHGLSSGSVYVTNYVLLVHIDNTSGRIQVCRLAKSAASETINSSYVVAKLYCQYKQTQW